jgi:hypothetical protein
MTIRIGMSGWVYEHWRSIFYPENLRQADWLSHYARVRHRRDQQHVLPPAQRGRVRQVARAGTPGLYLRR